MSQRTVAVLGAVHDPSRFANISLRAHLQKQWDAYPVNPRGGEAEGLPVSRKLADVPVEHLNRVTVYLSPPITLHALDDIAAKGCDEVWLNPGSYDDDVVEKAAKLGLNAITGCSIVALGISPSEVR